MQDWTPREHYTAEDLVEIIRILRDRDTGCPWDKVQTHASIRKNFLEETCEALEAIDADDPAMMQEELGDVLMQVVFHTVIEEERGRFDMEKVCREVCEKLVFRHPNIFASSAAENAGINGWDALKNKEKGRTTLADELDTVPLTLPALMRAQKLQKRAARFGCGPEDAAGAARALDSAKAGWDEAQTQESAGELLLCRCRRHAAGRCGRRGGPDLRGQAVHPEAGSRRNGNGYQTDTPSARIENVENIVEAFIMTKTDLIAQVAANTEMSKKSAEMAVNAAFEALGKAMAEGEKISISGFGTFEVRERAERQGINPRTREPITIAASKSIVFKPGKSLKDTL